MFDYHMHSTVSFDGISDAWEMAQAASRAGLAEICFTDHWDDGFLPEDPANVFTPEDYAEAYDTLRAEGVKIRRGVEFGMTVWNRERLRKLLRTRHFDFVIGSVHYVKEGDPYYAEFWQGQTVDEAFRGFLEETLRCVKVHDDFDVLGHLTYVCKSAHNPTPEPLRYEAYPELCDEIMRVLVQKGKGMEINTRGVDRVGVCLPDATILRRFRELGGEIVTVGSDAHSYDRVGQYAGEALEILKDIFGYVCTFEDRKPIFHRL